MAGTYQLLKNGKARLQYMYKGERYSTTINAKKDKEAQTALAHFIVSIQNGKISNSSMTYLEFAQKWMDEYVRTSLSVTVQQNYKRNLNNRILPYLGKKKLKDIDTSLLRGLFNDMKTWKTMYKPPRKNTYITKGTYEKYYEIITGSLQKAFEWGLIPSNPCRRIPVKSLKLDRLPSEIEKRKKGNMKIRAYSKNTYKSVLDFLNNQNNFDDYDRPQKVCTEFILKTGLCLSEIAGLEWERDWDQEKSTISVSIIQVYIKKEGWISKEPKEPNRTRTITLSASANQLLKNFRKEHPNNKYIFFELINFNSYTNWLKSWQLNNNIDTILTAHDLRHTHATLLLQQGVPVKYISKRLGHSSTKVTEDTYIEYLKEDDSHVADVIDDI